MGGYFKLVLHAVISLSHLTGRPGPAHVGQSDRRWVAHQTPSGRLFKFDRDHHRDTIGTRSGCCNAYIVASTKLGEYDRSMLRYMLIILAQ